MTFASVAASISRAPFRETGWQRLMRALADGGNRAEALRVFAQCRELIKKELGVAPSPETEEIGRALARPRQNGL